MQKLRVGVLVDSSTIPLWAYQMLEQIRDSEYASLVLIVESDRPTDKKNLIDKLNEALYLRYIQLDKARCKPRPDALKKMDIRHLLPDTAIVKIQAHRQGFVSIFKDSDVEKIKNSKLDVLIELGFRILRGNILDAAKYGIWAYRPGNDQPYQGGPVGFWEVFENRPETTISLQILRETEENNELLCRTYTATDYISITRNENKLLWLASSLVPRKLKELHELGEERFFERVRRKNQDTSFKSRKPSKLPESYETAQLLFKTAYKHFSKHIGKRFYLKQWILMYTLNGQGIPPTKLGLYRKVLPPKDRLWADPHIIEKDGMYFVFIEEVIYQTNKGHIAYLTIDQDGNYTQPKKIIDKPYHLSYPFVFSYQNKYYMIPETEENHTIELYKCVQFPEQWELDKVLMDNVYAVDTTLLQKDGKWWLFANMRANEGTSDWDELFLFYASDLFADAWTPHPMNPIISDVHTARPAGKIFSHQRNLYRPSQNCARRYGYRININQILTLNEHEYEENCVGAIEPIPGDKILATHTVNSVGRLTMIDAVVKRSMIFR